MRRPPVHPRGFTLVELTVYLVLTAVIATIGLPRYAGALRNFRCIQAATRVMADLAAAQWAARSTSTSTGVTVTFDLPNAAYAAPGVAVSVSDPPYNATLLAASFNGAAAVTFDRYGQPSSGGTVVVAVGASQRTVTVDANTGKASVQ
jgi:prepilin-type N-terminal cleavage/methylation domain-containing protein